MGSGVKQFGVQARSEASGRGAASRQVAKDSGHRGRGHLGAHLKLHHYRQGSKAPMQSYAQRCHWPFPAQSLRPVIHRATGTTSDGVAG